MTMSPLRKPTTDVLELAHQRGIKVLPAYDVLEFCAKHLRNSSSVESPNSSISPGSKNTKIPLRSPFIKVEDNECRFRPAYRELNEWPEINLISTPGTCPFVREAKTKKVTNNDNPTKSLEGLACLRPQEERKLLLKLPGSKDENGVKAEHQSTAPVKPRTPVNKKRNVMYCDICGIEFDNFAKVCSKSKFFEAFIAYSLTLCILLSSACENGESRKILQQHRKLQGTMQRDTFPAWNKHPE